MRTSSKILIGAAAVALGGCTYGDVGLGLGYGGYGDYGYGYGSPYYGYGYGSRYGYGYGPYGGYGAYPGYYGGFGSPFGWYGDYYYPGTGIYVYDSYRRPRLWTSRERSYWTNRQRLVLNSDRVRTNGSTSVSTSTRTSTRTAVARPNWSGFSRRSQMQSDETVQTRPRRRH